MSENVVIHVARLHWVLFLGPLLLMVSALLLGIYLPILHFFALVILGISILWGFINFLNYCYSAIILQPTHIVFKTGILVRNITDIPLGKIESVDVKQSIVGSIFRYGLLTITGTGGTKHTVFYLDRPLTFRRYIEQMIQGM